MKFDILTIFPKLFSEKDAYVNESILKRAQERKLITIKAHNIREYTTDKHRKVDDRPFGGGAGMVMMAQPILDAVASILKKSNPRRRLGRGTDLASRASGKTKVVILSAKGKQFNQKMAYDWAKKYERIVFLSGRYEGIDERVKTVLKAEEVSIGPYVLTDGEVATMVMISAVARLVPGVIRLESLQEESHWNNLLKKEATGGASGLEYPHYTRPEVLKWGGKLWKAPKVLLSGNHKNIDEWREKRRKTQ